MKGGLIRLIIVLVSLISLLALYQVFLRPDDHVQDNSKKSHTVVISPLEDTSGFLRDILSSEVRQQHLPFVVDEVKASTSSAKSMIVRIKIYGIGSDYLHRYPLDAVNRVLRTAISTLSAQITSATIRAIVSLPSQNDGKVMVPVADITIDIPLPGEILTTQGNNLLAICREGWISPSLY